MYYLRLTKLTHQKTVMPQQDQLAWTVGIKIKWIQENEKRECGDNECRELFLRVVLRREAEKWSSDWKEIGPWIKWLTGCRMRLLVERSLMS